MSTKFDMCYSSISSTFYTKIFNTSIRKLILYRSWQLLIRLHAQVPIHALVSARIFYPILHLLICIKGGALGVQNSNNVIIRYLRVRLGTDGGQSDTMGITSSTNTAMDMRCRD
jgi:hypothetical protein